MQLCIIRNFSKKYLLIQKNNFMEKIININRFAKVVKNEIIINSKKYLTLFGIALIPFIVALIFSFFTYFSVGIFSYVTFVGVICVFAPFMLYKNLFHRIKGVHYTMLPAKNSEKFLSMMVQNLFIIPLLLYIIVFVCMLFLGDVYDESRASILLQAIFCTPKNIIGENSFFYSAYWNTITFQSIAIWGVTFFRSHKVRKTLIVFLSLGFLISIIFMIIVLIMAKMGHSTNLNGLSFVFSKEIVNTTVHIISIVFPFVMWFWSYYKFTRQQL